MFFGKSKKNCHTCGVKVEKENAEVVSGKYFCSKKHAGEFRVGRNHSKKRGCCH